MINQNILTSSKSLKCFIGENHKSFFVKKIEGFNIMKCQHCGLIHLDQVYANPEHFLDDVKKAETEDTLEYWGYPEIFQKHKNIFEYYFQERLNRIWAAQPTDGPWLDIGSGYGLWLNFLNKNHISNEGIEIEKIAYNFSKKQGHSVSYANIEHWTTDQTFSVITMCDVLEHVTDPNSVIKKCYDFLKPGGLLYIQVPCVLGLRYPFHDSLGLPHHLWQFKPEILKNLVEQNAFHFIQYWTGVQGIIKHYENGEPALWRKFLWTAAKKTKRGNRLQLLAKKYE